MLWFLFALGAAAGEAVKGTLVKKATGNFDQIVVAWSWWVFGAIAATAVLLPVSLALGLPETGAEYWTIVLVRTFFEMFATLLYVHALRIAELSLAAPMLSLTPAFIVAIEWLWKGDMPSAVALAGIALIVVSTALLQWFGGSADARKHAKNIRGVGAMLVVSIFYAITSFAHRLGIEITDPYFYAWTSSAAMAIAFSVLMLVLGRHKTIARIGGWRAWGQLAAIGGIQAGAGLLQMIAQGLVLASLVTAAKRTSIIFSTVLGRQIFAEKERFAVRIFFIFTTIIGVILLVF